MTAWTAFASVAGVVTVLLLLLSHATSERFGGSLASDDERLDSSRDADALSERDADAVSAGGADVVSTVDDGGDRDEQRREVRDCDGRIADVVGPAERDADAGESPSLRGSRERAAARELSDAPSLSQPMLLANVAVSQGVFALALVASAVLADVPAAALGAAPATFSGALALVGVALGVGLYAVNEAGSRLADAAELGRSDALREFLAPESRLGWVVLLGGVLPIVAGFEELLFRGVLVGALAAGFGASPWMLVVASSVLFGLGHGAQGRLGVLVTSALGVVLGVAFVLTESLLVVVVAHYLVNALEFVVHEGITAD